MKETQNKPVELNSLVSGLQKSLPKDCYVGSSFAGEKKGWRINVYTDNTKVALPKEISGYRVVRKNIASPQ